MDFVLPRHQDPPLIMQRKPDMGLPMDLKRASIRIAFGLVTAGIRIEARTVALQSKANKTGASEPGTKRLYELVLGLVNALML